MAGTNYGPVPDRAPVPTASRQNLAAALRCALAPGAEEGELRDTVRRYVDAARECGKPVERVIVDLKEQLHALGAIDLYARPNERALAESVIRWCIEQYYGASSRADQTPRTPQRVINDETPDRGGGPAAPETAALSVKPRGDGQVIEPNSLLSCRATSLLIAAIALARSDRCLRSLLHILRERSAHGILIRGELTTRLSPYVPLTAPRCVKQLTLAGRLLAGATLTRSSQQPQGISAEARTIERIG